MITVFVEAYNKTIDVVFRVLDWMKGRSQRKLNNKREELEILAREAQLKGDVNELRRIRAEIEETDRDSKSLSNK
jgi:hypothetical protein